LRLCFDNRPRHAPHRRLAARDRHVRAVRVRQRTADVRVQRRQLGQQGPQRRVVGQHLLDLRPFLGRELTRQVHQQDRLVVLELSK
jgi:hypothetical protein